jgi:aminopeptidase N
MMQTLIGVDAFRAAMDLYFERHDGDAAIVEDFVTCMAEASGRDFKQFFRWYEQAGTPILSVYGVYNPDAKTYTLKVEQKTPRLEHEAEKQPFHMPIEIGLVGPDGVDLPLHLAGKGLLDRPLLEITDAEHVFVFNNIFVTPVLSFNRGFSAPIILRTNQSAEELLFLMGYDSDNFNRWEAAQSVGKLLIEKTYLALKAGTELPDCTGFAQSLGRTLADAHADESFKSLMFTLPSAAEIAALLGTNVDSDAVHEARRIVTFAIAKILLGDIKTAFANTAEHGAYQADVVGTSRRSLHYTLLGLIAAVEPEEAGRLAREEWLKAENMTCETGAISALLHCDIPDRDLLLAEFHAKHHDDPLILDKWLAMNASIPGTNAATRVAGLMQHSDFKITTPNRVYALIGNFSGNMTGFHAANGAGYALVADVIIELNAINPQVAARMATGFRSWALYDEPRRAHAQKNMERILAVQDLSSDVFEIISRTLKS